MHPHWNEVVVSTSPSAKFEREREREMTDIAAPPAPAPLQHMMSPLPPPESPTLLVKHLPDALPLDTLKRLFSHYGASDIRPCVAAKMKNCAFVDFKDEAQAAQAQAQLHRLRFLGKILAVERAKPYTPKTLSNDLTVPPPLPSTMPQMCPSEAQRLSSSVNVFERGTAGAGLRHEPIAPSLGIDYPFPPHLEYAYPPPDGNILTNIVNALIAVPRFYTQVLHLMNKMNLPAPFRPALPTPPLPPPPPKPAAPVCPDGDLSSDESELESSEEIGPAVDTVENVRDSGQVTKKRKGLVEEAEEPKSALLVPRERPLIKKKRPVLQINLSSKKQSKVSAASESHDGVEEPVRDSSLEEVDDVKEDSVEPRSSATREELIAGKMPLNELFSLPMLKNYTRGTPTPVLYLKNLAKDVTQDDLYFIFGAVFTNSEDFRSQLGVKLMQEGRMRGQAFVTFPSVALAEDALNIVHGYMLKGKPMVVQFGRNPAATNKTNTIA